jgi:hypothetical protein
MAFVNLNKDSAPNAPVGNLDYPRQGRKHRKEEDVFIKGTFKWVKYLQPDFQFDADGKWSCVVYLMGEELEKARELQAQGIKNTIKKDDDGWYMTLSRKCSYQVKGRHVGREPPKVFRTIDGVNVPCTDPIGNGSSGVAKCILWSSPNFPGKNLRWEELRIDHLIPYTAETAYPDGGESLKKFEEQPPEKWY